MGSNEPILETNPTQSTEIWTTVGKSRKNKFSNQITGSEDNIGAFHESQSLEAENKENQKEVEADNDQSQDINLHSEVVLKDIQNINKSTKCSSKKDKQRKK